MMANIVMDHGASWCFGTSLAPRRGVLDMGGLPPYDDVEGEALQLGAASRGSAREFFESCRATATRVPGVSVLHGSGARHPAWSVRRRLHHSLANVTSASKCGEHSVSPSQVQSPRLSGIDCPEKGRAYGKRAKQAASALTFGKEVTLQTYGKDKYGRTLADVLLSNGTNVNHELVKDGW